MKNETLKEYAKKRADEVFDIDIDELRQLVIDGAKWQAKKMYSEEEVRHIVSEALQSALVTVDLEQWFKQFKKK